MALVQSYAELQSDILDTLNRTDLVATVTEFSSGPIEGAVKRAVSLGELRLQRELRPRQAETSTTLSVSSTTKALPSDYMSQRLMYVSGDPIQILTFDTIENLKAAYPNAATGKPQMVAVFGSNFEFGPAPDATYSVPLYYYQKPTLLSDANTSNIWLTSFPDMLKYAAIFELTAHISEDERLQVWKQLYDEGVRAINGDQTISRWTGGVIRASINPTFVV